MTCVGGVVDGGGQQSDRNHHEVAIHPPITFPFKTQLVDNTPILDVKPYLPWYDQPTTEPTFAPWVEAARSRTLEVEILPEAREQLAPLGRCKVPLRVRLPGRPAQPRVRPTPSCLVSNIKPQCRTCGSTPPQRRTSRPFATFSPSVRDGPLRGAGAVGVAASHPLPCPPARSRSPFQLPKGQVRGQGLLLHPRPHRCHMPL